MHWIGLFPIVTPRRTDLVGRSWNSRKSVNVMKANCCAMAEVRVRFRKGIYELLKPPRSLAYFEKDSKGMKKTVRAAALLCNSQNERVATKDLDITQACQRITKNHFVIQSQGTFCRTADEELFAVKARDVSLTDTQSGISHENLLDSISKAWSSEGRLFRSTNFTEPLSVARVHTMPARTLRSRRSGIQPILTAIYHGSTHRVRREHMRFLTTRSFYQRSLLFRPTNSVISERAFSGTYTDDSTEMPLHKTKSAYYDILGVSPSATQAQIKTAYYKQSFLYHPDKNAGSEESAFRFSQISEAYNVLGNKSLRRKYDRGILSHTDVHGANRPSTAAPSASKPQKRSHHSPSVGIDSQNIFDFDKFYRAHYGEQLQRERDLRTRREEFLKKKEQGYQDWKLGRMTEMAVGMLLAIAVAMLFSLKSK